MPKKKYAGRITVRTSYSIHKKLVETAEKEAVSLNLLVNNLLTAGLEKKPVRRRKKK